MYHVGGGTFEGVTVLVLRVCSPVDAWDRI